MWTLLAVYSRDEAWSAEYLKGLSASHVPQFSNTGRHVNNNILPMGNSQGLNKPETVSLGTCA